MKKETIKEEKSLGLISPWIDFYRQVQALFQEDDEVEVKFNEETCELKIYVENSIKADAISKLMPTEKTFGDITIKISVIPANVKPNDPADLIRLAFNGNPALEDILVVNSPFGEMKYVIFAKEVVQYQNDDMGDFFGLKSTLYEDLAREVLNTNGVYFCTSDE